MVGELSKKRVRHSVRPAGDGEVQPPPARYEFDDQGLDKLLDILHKPSYHHQPADDGAP